MIKSFVIPPQCIVIEQGIVTAFTTRNSQCEKNFEQTNLLELDDEGVLKHLSKDLLGSSPTPGFDITIKGKVFGVPSEMLLSIKVEHLYGTPKSNEHLLRHVGIEAEAWSSLDDRVKPLKLRTYLRLDSYNRWSVAHCHLFQYD